MYEEEAVLWRQVFDFWRQSYDEMDYSAHQRFYNMVARRFPDQRKADTDAVESALIHLLETRTSLNVWELGGWDGALAHDMIETFSGDIEEWRNIEICDYAVQAGWRDEAGIYLPECPSNWVSEYTLPWELRGYDIAILSHVIEHLSSEHLWHLLYMLQEVPYLYIQTPSAMGDDPHPTRWMGTMSTHKLEVGWQTVMGRLEELRYWVIWQKGQARFFGKREVAHG